MPRYVIERTFPDELAINFKTLTFAAAVLSSVVFAMPISSQAMPQAAPVKIEAASNGNLGQVYYRGYCGYGRCYAPYHSYSHDHERYRPYYGYYRPYYRYYRPYCYHPVIMIYPGGVSVQCAGALARDGQDGDGR